MTNREWALVLDALSAWHLSLNKLGYQNLAEKIYDIREEIKRQFHSTQWDRQNGREGIDVRL